MTFPRGHPDYRRDEIDWLRITEYSRVDETYLDYTGACLYPESLIMNHLWQLRSSVYGNSHSDSPTSLRSTEVLRKAKAAVLEFFNADPAVYDVVFTANATAAMQLVGLSFPYTTDSSFLCTADVHNSALGLREIARAQDVPCRYVSLKSDLQAREDELAIHLQDRPGLFVYPAQCNFSGVQHPLEWIDTAHHYSWRILLDAAAFVPTNRLDLSRYQADFVAVSWYKVFGWPTGIGSLITTHVALAELQQPWHSGGNTRAASVQAGWFHLVSGAEAFQHGTVDYLSLPGVTLGCEFIRQTSIEAIHDRVSVLTEWTISELIRLRHTNGTSLVIIYGPSDMAKRGGIITFNFLTPDGALVDERIVSHRASEWKISLRTGCFCAPGAGETAFHLTPASLEAAGEISEEAPFDDYLHALGMTTGGAVRISYGLASNADDAERFVAFASTFVDQTPAEDNLPSRVHC